MKKVLGLVGAALLFAGPALAADLGKPVYKAPAPAALLPSGWGGFYIGIHGGYGWGHDSVDVDLSPLSNPSPKGGVFGGQIGYNWQSQQFIYGIEADISLSDISVSETLVGPGVLLSATGSIDWLATIRGRYGVLVQPRLLIYATAGLGIVGAEVHSSANVMGFPQFSARQSDTATGFVYGIGAEHQLSERMSARVEYLGFGHVDRVGDFGIIRAGLNFKFGQ